MKKTLFDILLLPFLIVGVIVLACWLIFVRILDLVGDIRDRLAGRTKPCDKEPAKRRPRRAF